MASHTRSRGNGVVSVCSYGWVARNSMTYTLKSKVCFIKNTVLILLTYMARTT